MQASQFIPGKNPFIEDDYEDIDDEAFLQNVPSRRSGWSGNSVQSRSRATEENWQELLSEKLKIEEQDLQSISQQLLSQQMQTEEKSLQSTVRSKALLFETEQAGIATAENLMMQREQLERTHARLDDTENYLKTSKTYIKCMKSITSSVINSFRKKSKDPTSPSTKKKDKSNSSNNPTRLGRIVKETSDFSSNPTNRAVRERDLVKEPLSVSEQIEENIEEMIPCVWRLKELALGLSGEIDSQDRLIERMLISADKSDWQVRKQTKDMKKI